MSLVSRGRLPGDAGGADLAALHGAGMDGGSGMVAPAAVLTDPDAGGRVDMLGHDLVHTDPQHASDLAPIPGVVTRPMLGGVRTAHFTRLLNDPPAFDGSHVELVNRVSVAVLAPVEQLTPAPVDALPSLRVVPVSDPYGRMCANAAAVAEASR